MSREFFGVASHERFFFFFSRTNRNATSETGIVRASELTVVMHEHARHFLTCDSAPPPREMCWDGRSELLGVTVRNVKCLTPPSTQPLIVAVAAMG